MRSNSYIVCDFVAQSCGSLSDVSAEWPPDGFFECDTASTGLEWLLGVYIYGIYDLPATAVGLELHFNIVDDINYLFILSNSGLCFEMVGLDSGGLLLLGGFCVGSVGMSISSSESTSSSRAPRAPVFGSARDGSGRSVSSSKASSTVGGRGGMRLCFQTLY